MKSETITTIGVIVAATGIILGLGSDRVGSINDDIRTGCRQEW